MKNKIRKELKEKRRKLSSEYVKQKSDILYKKIVRSEIYQKSKIIMSYCSIQNEVDTLKINKKILNDGKKLIIPYIERKKDIIIPVEIKNMEELVLGKYGILESKNLQNRIKKEKIDLILVPAIAYDKLGNRIGFGGGYYDKFMGNYNGIKIGLAYSFQIIEKIETEKHDIKLDKV
ncbi:MAG: 5-formyltetrahydrofolate cyclo-ligase, partial [Fusobacteriia bacterium 4572_132]